MYIGIRLIGSQGISVVTVIGFSCYRYWQFFLLWVAHSSRYHPQELPVWITLVATSVATLGTAESSSMLAVAMSISSATSFLLVLMVELHIELY